ncbi:MAG TPA: DUF5060 domain-containing protein, partial [Bacteroidia bacterium]|nr:DUF5060 domain-containing protein [Bacteroidia bacterium]
MKKYLSVFAAFTASQLCIAQQSPYTPVDDPLAPITSGQYNFSGPGETFSPFYYDHITFTQTSETNMTAKDRVHLQPGFHAGDYTGNGYFHAFIANPDFNVVFITPDEHLPQVGQFEKLEIGMQLPASVDQQVNDFLADPNTGLNPFDPDKISVEATFTNGLNSYTVYGFYYDEFTRDVNAMAPRAPANWIAQPTLYHWRIRFAPPFTGSWYCTIGIRVNDEANPSYLVNGIYFTCVPSSNQGWLKKGNDNWHLAYSGSDASFFALGQNIAWTDPIKPDYHTSFNGGNNPDVPNYPLYDAGYLDILNWIADLSQSGGNMVRMSAVPWNYDVEFEHLNNYKDRMNRAWELDRVFDQCEQENMKISMEFEFIGKDDANGNPYFLWSNNPYHTELSGVTDKAHFFSDPDARVALKKKLRYFLSRWGYSTCLGIFALTGEINGGFGSIDDYENSPSLQVSQTEWEEDLFQYSKALMNYR